MKGKDFPIGRRTCHLTVWRNSWSAPHTMKRGKGARPLAGKEFALLFEKPSLRTRVSFEVGIRQLGGTCTYLSQQDVGLGVREPEADIARRCSTAGWTA